MNRHRELIAWVVTLAAVTTMIVISAQLQALRSSVAAACGGVVARLDLTEWVEPCLTVK